MSYELQKIRQLFPNIVKNAFEAVESMDSTQKKIQISFNLKGKDFVGIVIEDSGVGLPKLNEGFIRPLKSTKPHGSGLGLLVSKKIVEAHNGELIASYSKELGGAKFEVIIPNKALI